MDEIEEYQIKESQLNHFLGKITEKKVEKIFLEEGHKICKCVKQGRKKNNWFVYLNIEKIEKVIEDYKGEKERLLKIMKENIKGLPDFLVFKDNKLFFLEVKSRSKPIDFSRFSPFSENQLKVFPILEEEGFKVKWFHVKLDIHTNEKPPSKLNSP